MTIWQNLKQIFLITKPIKKRKSAAACSNNICKWLCTVSNCWGGHRNNRGHTNKTEKTKEHHTHLNVNAFFWLFAIEHPLDVELGTSGVLMYRRSDFLPLTGDNHVRIWAWSKKYGGHVSDLQFVHFFHANAKPPLLTKARDMAEC